MTSTLIQYDVVFIGQLGAVVCNILTSSSALYKCLVIANAKQIIQPSLLPIQSPVVAVNKNCPKNCDLQTQSIFKICPQDNLVVMENKKSYRYKFLVYASDLTQWCNFNTIQNLYQALQTNYSFVYSNIYKSQPKLSQASQIFERLQKSRKLQIKRKSVLSSSKNKICQGNGAENLDTERILDQNCSINIVFYIPNPPHSGYDNFNILFKIQQYAEYYMKKIVKIKISDSVSQEERNKQSEKEAYKLNFILFLQGECIFPKCQKIDMQVKQMLQLKGVKIRKKHKIQKIDYLRRKIYINYQEQKSHDIDENKQISISISNKMTIKFDYLHVVIQQKTPCLLSECQIDPFSNCPKTLCNEKYKNMYIFGADIFPTTHSYQAVNYQGHTISRNILWQLKNSSKQGSIQNGLQEYNGFTSFYLWISKCTYIKLKHQYEQDKQQQQIANNSLSKYMVKKSGCCFSSLQAAKHRFLFHWQVQLLYNLKSYGTPHYFIVPEMANTQ